MLLMMDRSPVSNVVSLFIGSAVTLVLLFGLYKLADSYIEKSIGYNYQHTRNEAIDQCMEEARSVVANVFNETLYKVCLRDKGFSSSLTN